MTSVTTTSIVTFCIVAVCVLTVLRFCILTRAPVRIFLSNLRARYDSGYAERREQERERLRVLELEAQQAAVAAHAARTRLWYGYRFPEPNTDRLGEGSRGVPLRNLLPLNITMTASEVDFNFPSKPFKHHDCCKISDDAAKKPNFVVVPGTPVNTPMPEKNLDSPVVSELILPVEGTDIPENACIVCLEEMRDFDPTKLLTCGHVYHSACITEWLVCHKAVCPLCRFDYSILHEDDSELRSSSSQLPQT